MSTARSRRKLRRAREHGAMEMMVAQAEQKVDVLNKRKERIICLHCGKPVKKVKLGHPATNFIRCMGCGRTATEEEMKPIHEIEDQRERDPRLVVPVGSEKATSIILTDAPGSERPSGLHTARDLTRADLERSNLATLDGRNR